MSLAAGLCNSADLLTNGDVIILECRVKTGAFAFPRDIGKFVSAVPV